MQVILVKPVRKLGNITDVVEVSGGYARNYLLPYNYAIRMNKKNIQSVKQNLAHLEQENTHRITIAQEIVDKIKNAYVAFIRKAIDSYSSCNNPYDIRIFGSITEKDIINSLDITSTAKTDTYISTGSIKTLGIHAVAVHLHPQLPACTVYVNIARSEADAQLYERIHQQVVSLHANDEEKIKQEWLLKLQQDDKKPLLQNDIKKRNSSSDIKRKK